MKIRYITVLTKLEVHKTCDKIGITPPENGNRTLANVPRMKIMRKNTHDFHMNRASYDNHTKMDIF